MYKKNIHRETTWTTPFVLKSSKRKGLYDKLLINRTRKIKTHY